MKALFKLTVILVFFLVVIMQFSCSKDSGGGIQYFVLAKINGVELKNTGYATAVFTDIPTIGFKTCTIQGSASATSTSNLITAGIVDNAAITTKQYTAVDIGGATQATINYTDKNGVAYSSTYTTSPDAVITITGLTATDLTGTFSGTVTQAPGGSSVVITEGSFVVKRLY